MQFHVSLFLPEDRGMKGSANLSVDDFSMMSSPYQTHPGKGDDVDAIMPKR
jgi:hypothetical protein